MNTAAPWTIAHAIPLALIAGTGYLFAGIVTVAC
jgi:hypothetical protein